MTDAVLSLQGVCAGYGTKNILQSVDLCVKENEILTLAGPNGCGKSTLLKTAAGLLPHTSGKIYIKGKVLADYAPKELAKIAAILPQSRSVPGIRVEQLALHGRFPYLGMMRRPSRGDWEKVEEAMELAGVAAMRDRDLRTLSGGERQKAYLAMAIAQDTPLLFLDEPTTYLDIGKQFEILEMVQILQSRGKTIVMVLHDLAHALTYSTQIAVMQQGAILSVQPPKEVFSSGLLQSVFHVTGHCTQTETQNIYYFTPEK